MKKILILLSLSILFISCGNKEEKINLDKADEKIIEDVLDVSNTGSKDLEAKTETKTVEKTEVKTETKIETKDKVEVKTKTDTGITNESETKITPEEEAEANKLLDELLGGEGDVNSVLDDISK